MVMPRSRSRSMESRYWARMSRASTAPVSSRIRSDSVVLPWSMWLMMERLRIRSRAIMQTPLSQLGIRLLRMAATAPSGYTVDDLDRLRNELRAVAHLELDPWGSLNVSPTDDRPETPPAVLARQALLELSHVVSVNG